MTGVQTCALPIFLRTSLKKEFFHALFEQLPAFGIPLEGLHTETGPGTYEAAIAHANVMEAADRAVLFKTAVKEIAYQHQAMATFMAKVNETLPGCGGHIHQSLWDASQKKNLFYDVKDRQQLSETAKSYLAGQLDRKSTRLNSSHIPLSRMPSSA